MRTTGSRRLRVARFLWTDIYYLFNTLRPSWGTSLWYELHGHNLANNPDEPGLCRNIARNETGNQNREKSGNSVFIHMIKNFHKFTRIITILSQETHGRQIESKNSVINKADGREFYRDRQRPVLWRRQAKIREKSAKWKAIRENSRKLRAWPGSAKWKAIRENSRKLRAWPGICGWPMILQFRRWSTTGECGHLLLVGFADS